MAAIVRTLVLLCWLATGAAHAQTLSPRVRIDSGEIEGGATAGLLSFKGIPYAAAPVGPLRWRAPQPVAPWTGVRPATQFGWLCLQSVPDTVIPESFQNEDCLTLNVWTPAARRGEKLPVMVWLHGGGFFAGAGSMPLYDGEKLAREGVIVVTLNYRLGRLGFFAHPALSAEPTGAPKGNYGLLDQVEALRWVQRNIAAFGGDPKRVTLLGESAGALSANYLLTSPRTAGLFARAISMSGFARTPVAPIRDAAPNSRSGEAVGLAVAEALGVPNTPDAAARLRALPARALAPALVVTDPLLPVPMIDGELVTESIISAYRRGAQHKVDLMVGGVSWETSVFPHLRALAPILLPMMGDQNRVQALLDPGKTGDKERIADRLVTLAVGTEPNRFQAERTAAAGNRAFLYDFAYVPEARRDAWRGTPHGGELAYLFGTLARHPASYFLVDFPKATPADEAVGDAMRRYWVAFAKHGDPGNAGGARWPAYRASAPATLRLGNEAPRAATAFEGVLLDLLRQIAEAAAK